MDETELRQQLEEHHLASFGWALVCCGRATQEAEDVLQSVYLKVLDGRARYDGRASFRTWLFAVIRNTAADERRRHWLRQLKLAAFGGQSADAMHEETGAHAAARSEQQSHFLEKLATLPQRQRHVLHLVFYQGLTIQEAATALGVSVGSARQHYERGKHRLRDQLQQAEVFHESEFRREQTPATLP